MPPQHAMKDRVIVIDMPKERLAQTALIVDGRLDDLIIDPPSIRNLPAVGQVFQAKVERLAPSAGGAFLKLSDRDTGFLREAKGVRQGDLIKVQVSSYAEPGKALPVSKRRLYKGQTIIVTPEAPGINVSRNIKSPDERERLTSVVEMVLANIGQSFDNLSFDLETMGVIVRSAAEGASEHQIGNNLAYVLQNMEACEGSSVGPEIGALGWASQAFVMAVSDLCVETPDAIVVADHDGDGLSEVQGAVFGTEVENCIDASIRDPFDHFGVWDEIEKLKSPRADLPSGGWMAVEATRAMVTVDVNTGDQFSGGAGMTANVEAARELPRQLRLRGLGGQVIVDFAPMKKAHRKKIEEVLKAAFRRDPIETSLAGWTPLGNFELQRKRERRPLTEVLRD